ERKPVARSLSIASLLRQYASPISTTEPSPNFRSTATGSFARSNSACHSEPAVGKKRRPPCQVIFSGSSAGAPAPRRPPSRPGPSQRPLNVPPHSFRSSIAPPSSPPVLLFFFFFFRSPGEPFFFSSFFPPPVFFPSLFSPADLSVFSSA